ncbi:hypothetical protein HOY82DRAFT_261184 [Tuber indicum]|nr:hypothetical protein HOY82DRAFT_261184 [Tuber indicum]
MFRPSPRPPLFFCNHVWSSFPCHIFIILLRVLFTHHPSVFTIVAATAYIYTYLLACLFITLFLSKHGPGFRPQQKVVLCGVFLHSYFFCSRPFFLCFSHLSLERKNLLMGYDTSGFFYIIYVNLLSVSNLMTVLTGYCGLD